MNKHPKIQGLYVLTDEKLMPEETFESIATQLLSTQQVQILQYRDKSQDTQKRLKQAHFLKDLCEKNQTVFLINDDANLAKAVNADGVHLGQSDDNLSWARQLLGPDKIIGITCHDSLTFAQQAIEAGADYLAFGRFFPSQTKPNASAADLSLLPTIKSLTHLPIVAIGGITLDNAPQVIDAGANAVAVVHDILTASDIPHRVRQYQQLFS